MSRDGLLPRGLAAVNEKRGTPARITIGVGVAVALIAGFSDIGVLEEMVNVGTLFAFVLVSIGVVVLRRKRPDLERSYRVPLVPVIPILSVLACLWLMINLTAITWVRFLVWMVIGVVVYFFYGRKHSMVQRRAGDGLELTQEEIKATWRAERDSGWVGDRQERQDRRGGGSSAAGGAASSGRPGPDVGSGGAGPDRPAP